MNKGFETCSKYDEDTFKELANIGEMVLKSETEKACVKLGLKDVEVKIVNGVRPKVSGPDAIVLKDGKILFYVEFKTTSGDCNGRLADIRAVFKEEKAQLGLILGKDGIEIYQNKPQVDLVLGRVCQNKLDQFYGAFVIPGLGLISGLLTGTDGKAVNVTDNTGKWIGEFQDSYLDHSVVDGSTVLGSRLALTSVGGSYLQNVRSTGTTIAGSTITDSNVSAKMIYDSILQNSLAVCSTIINSVIDLCRILNSTLVSVVNLVGSHVEDSSIAYSANILNCTVMNSTLMWVLDLSNTSIIRSNLTFVANVDNSRIERSDISYSANISRSEITNTKLVGSTVQGSRLTSCTAIDSNLRNVNATNSNLTRTKAENSNLINVNATNSKLTKANVEYSNLENVELKNVEVYGTNMKNVKVADKTVVYGRVINSNGDLDPVHRVGTPNYSGKDAKRFEQTNIEFHSETAPSSTGKTSSQGSASSGTKTKSNVTNSGKTPSSSSQSQTQQNKQTTSNQSTSTPSQEEKSIRRGSNIWIN